MIRPETLLPPTAIETLTQILQRDGAQQSATTMRRTLDSRASQLHNAALRYGDAVGFAAEQTLGDAALSGLDRQIDVLLPGLTDQPAYPTLRAHLAMIAVDGADPLNALLDAASIRELNTADDPAAVLDWRIDHRHGEGPLPWLPCVSAGLANSPDWGPYLAARSTRVASLAAQVHAQALAWTPVQTPEWAKHLTGKQDATLRADLAVWRAAFAVSDTDHRPAGPRQLSAATARHQSQLKRRYQAATGGDDFKRMWDLPAEVLADPQRSRLFDRLASLDQAGIDVGELVSTALAEERPLPEEVAADALWWRIAGHLGPAAVPATGSPTATLRPSWTTVLVAQLGDDAAERVLADPAWPALVAAVHAANEEWTPEQLIATAIDGIHQVHGNGAGRADELCEALVWRVALLTEPPPEHQEPIEPDLCPCPDADPSTTTPAIDTARIVELNKLALAYYQDLYPRSWAPTYLRDRLGTDLNDHPRYAVGYAPPGPNSLVRRLVGLGATENELTESGLARRTETGRVVDVFRDRLVFPIHDGDDLVGFITRRNPTKDNAEYAGPKYLNTRTTAAFSKGEHLYGLTEAHVPLGAGATPVLVEGPIDALAVTIASHGDAVGIAPLGTAFTDTQVRHLKPYINEAATRVVVATDADHAGWLSAQRAYWRLTQHGADPLHLPLSAGVDPAELLQDQEAPALREALRKARPLASVLLDEIIEERAKELDTPAARLRSVKEAGQVIGALPPDRWLTHIEVTTTRLGLPPGMLHMEVADAGHTWTQQSARVAAQRIRETGKAALPRRGAGPPRRPLTPAPEPALPPVPRPITRRSPSPGPT